MKHRVFVKTGDLLAAGVLIMLIIAIQRYLSIAYHLKPPISNRKLKVVCSMVYFVSFTLGYAMVIPSCADKNEHKIIVNSNLRLFSWNYSNCRDLLENSTSIS